MVNYGSLSPLETIIMAVIVVATNVTGLPIAFKLVR